MQTSQQWYAYFKVNLQKERIDWATTPTLTMNDLNTVTKSIQAWQLGETSEGKDLIKAAQRYAKNIGDPYYVQAVELFIKEEQKHGNNLGIYLDNWQAKG